MSKVTLINIKQAHRSRIFARLPVVLTFHDLYKCILRLSGATITDVIRTKKETWIDFTCAGHIFTITRKNNEYLLSVEFPHSPDQILQIIADHFYISQQNSAEQDAAANP